MEFNLRGFFGQAEMFSIMDEAASHLRVALAQTLPTDDQIIMGHVKDALALLELREPESGAAQGTPQVEEIADYLAVMMPDSIKLNTSDRVPLKEWLVKAMNLYYGKHLPGAPAQPGPKV